MSFKSVMKKVGKVALKAAPIAAAFIPGVGPLASMAIGGLASGASKKLEGGSWKDSLISGGLGAATGYGASKVAGGLKGAFSGKGLAPSANIAGKIGNAASGGSKLGAIMGAVPLGLGAASAIGGALGGGGGSSNQGGGPLASSIPRSALSTPDLSTALRAGSRAAVQDQGFRKGYDINILNEPTPAGQEPSFTTRRMGPITASYAKYAKQQEKKSKKVA